MTNKQTNYSNMINAVIAYLEAHTTEVAESAGFVEALNALKDLADDIHDKNNEKTGATNGKSAKKEVTERELTVQILKVSSGLFLWAKKNKNSEIKELAHITKSFFARSRDAEKYNIAKAIFEAATGKDLAFTKVTTADVTLLGTLAEQYKKDMGGVSTGLSQRSASGKSLDNMIDEALVVLSEETDKYMQQYSEENQEFHNGYKSARVIWDKGGKQKVEEPVAPVNP